MHYFDFLVSENMHRGMRFVIFDYSTAYFEWWWRYWGGHNVEVFVGAAHIFILVKYDLVNRD